MYCPTCELEIEGKGQTECAICESPLVESRAEADALEQTASEEEMKLQELIQEIHQTVEAHVDDTGEVEESSADTLVPDECVAGEDASDKLPEAPLESALDSGAESSEDVPGPDASLALDEGAEPVELDAEDVNEPETVGLEDDRNQEEPEERPALKAHPPADESDVGSDVIDEDEPESAGSDLEVQSDEEPEERGWTPPHQAPELSAEPVADLEAPVSTEDGLGQAPDDTDADEGLIDSSVRESSSKTLLYVVVLVIAVIATGAYYSLNHLSEPPPQEKVTAAKEQDRVLAAARERDANKAVQPRVKPRTRAPKASVARKAPLKGTASANHATDEIPMKPAAERTMPVRKAAKTVRPVSERPVEKRSAAAVVPRVPRNRVAKIDLTDQLTTRIKEPKVAKAEPRVIPMGYRSIQAGSFRARSSAGGVVSELRKLGFDAYVEQANLGAKGVWYRVKIGEFKTMKEAELKQNELNQAFEANTWIVTKRK